MKRTEKKRSFLVAGMGVVVSAMASSGCLEGDVGHKFRAATAANFETALTSIATGLIDGALTIYTPDSSTTTTTE